MKPKKGISIQKCAKGLYIRKAEFKKNKAKTLKLSSAKASLAGLN